MAGEAVSSTGLVRCWPGRASRELNTTREETSDHKAMDYQGTSEPDRLELNCCEESGESTRGPLPDGW